MKTWIDFDDAPIFAIPLTDAVGGVSVCEGMLIEGPQGWGEFSPPVGVSEVQAARWLTSAIEAGIVGWPDPLRGRVPVAVIVPSVPAARARELVELSHGCRTAAVRVGESTLAEDIARLEAVRDALGAAGAIRCDANGAWDLETATSAVPALDRAAGGLEFIEQPCAALEDVAALRRRVEVPVAVDQSIRDADEPLGLPLEDAADVMVLTVGALGGVRRALRIAEGFALPCVAAAEVQSSVAIAGGLALAGVLSDAGFAHSLGGAMLLDGDVVSEARHLVPVDGYLPVAPMPPSPDLARLQEFAATDAERVARWRGLLGAVQKYL
ncbi:MAG: o-succinylbenzoate synthase [Mycobacterium sp.]